MGLIPLQLALGAACFGVAGYVLYLLVRDERPTNLLLNALVAIEVGLLVHLIVGLVMMLRSDNDVPVWEYVGYLLSILLILPAGVVWSSSERSRSGTAVLLVAVLVVPFLLYRTYQLWVL